MVDERYRMHRLKSTSLAGVVGGVFGALLFAYFFYVRHTLQWDLAAVVGTMAIVKAGALVYYRTRN